MTSVLALRVGPIGRVFSYEPHPEVFKELSRNIETWQKEAAVGAISAHELGLADHRGEGLLGETDRFANNRGTASLLTASEAADHCFAVPLARLDDLLSHDSRIGVMKIDVEGSELQVLRGALDLIKRRRIRDIVFEEHHDYPTPVTSFLEHHGYRLYHLGLSALGPSLAHVSERPLHRQWDPPSCVATLDAERVLTRLRARGWQSLR